MKLLLLLIIFSPLVISAQTNSDGVPDEEIGYILNSYMKKNTGSLTILCYTKWNKYNTEHSKFKYTFLNDSTVRLFDKRDTLIWTVKNNTVEYVPTLNDLKNTNQNVSDHTLVSYDSLGYQVSKNKQYYNDAGFASNYSLSKNAYNYSARSMFSADSILSWKTINEYIPLDHGISVNIFSWQSSDQSISTDTVYNISLIDSTENLITRLDIKYDKYHNSGPQYNTSGVSINLFLTTMKYAITGPIDQIMVFKINPSAYGSFVSGDLLIAGSSLRLRDKIKFRRQLNKEYRTLFRKLN